MLAEHRALALYPVWGELLWKICFCELLGCTQFCPFLRPHPLIASTTQQLNTPVRGHSFVICFQRYMGKVAYTFQSIYQLWIGDEWTLEADKQLCGERKGSFPVSYPCPALVKSKLLGFHVTGGLHASSLAMGVPGSRVNTWEVRKYF